jgi:hypothetical protein
MDKVAYQPVSHDHEAFLKKALKRKEFRTSYEALEEEYRLAREMLAARTRMGLTQDEPWKKSTDGPGRCWLPGPAWD